MPRILLLAALLSALAGCRGPCPFGCTPSASAPEPRAEGDGPRRPASSTPIGDTCRPLAELAIHDCPPPASTPAFESCKPSCLPAPPAQRVIVEVVQRVERPASVPAPAPAPALPLQASPMPASGPALVTAQGAAAYAVMPAVPAQLPAAPRMSVGVTLDWFRLPVPFPRLVAVPAPPEAPTLLLMQQAAAMMPAPLPVMPAPQQYANVPVTGTALVPVAPAPPALPPALAMPPCGSTAPPVSAQQIDALTMEVLRLQKALEQQRK